MATGIFPEDVAGGVVIRDADGNPTHNPDVHNAYVPSPAFISTCLLTALPTDCTARIEARQINAIVSELVSFAECMDPDGPWDCASLTNLCNAFTTWVSIHLQQIYASDDPPTNPEPNRMWFETDTGTLFIFFDDGDTQQWVQVSGAIVDQISIVGAGTASDPHSVGTVDCGSF